MSHTNGHRLFFGFEARGDWMAVVALDEGGYAMLRARFPLRDQRDQDLDFGPAAPIAAALKAFVNAYGADVACGADHAPPALVALAKHLGGPVRYVGFSDLDRTALPGHDPLVRRELGVDAHQRALLAGLATAAREDF